jgi:CBS domain-containing protein
MISSTHLPVVSENKFLGLISEEDLIDVEDEKFLSNSYRIVL